MNIAIAVTSGALNVRDEIWKVMGRSQLTPPIVSMMATMAITRAKPRRARGPWYLLGIFMF